MPEVDIVLDDTVFAESSKTVMKSWKENREVWGNSDFLCFIQGTIDEDVLSYSKSNTFQVYLFGIEFSDTAILFCESCVYIISSESKAKRYLAPMIQKVTDKHILNFEVKILVRKRNDTNNSLYEELKASLPKSFEGRKMGLFLKDKDNWTGKFISEYFAGIKDSEFEEVDINSGVNLVFAQKSEKEQEKVHHAGNVCKRLLKGVFAPEMESIIKEGRKVKHSKIAETIEKSLETPEKYGIKYDISLLDICHQPIIQSGGVYSLKPSAQSDDMTLSQDIILCAIGIRYDGYCAALARTFFINPSLFQEKCYSAIVEVESAVQKLLVPGAVLGDVYDKAEVLLNEKAPFLLQHFTKECGTGIGLEFRESALRIKHGNTEVVKQGMCFNVRMGVENVPNKIKDTEHSVNDLKTFSILLSDTIIVGELQTAAPVFGVAATSNRVVTQYSTEWSNVSFELADDSDSDSVEDVTANSGRRVTRGLVREERLRTDPQATAGEESALSIRSKHQKKLITDMQARKQKEEKGESEDAKKEVEVEDIAVFPSPSHYPADMHRDQLFVDTEHEVLFLPIHGLPVPFSVHTIKSVSMNEEGGYGYFRVNFHTPQTKTSKDVSATMFKAMEQFPSATYIKNITFRSRDQTNMNVQLKRIKNMMKQRKQQDKFNEDAADIVEQGDLVLLTNQKPPYLSEIDMRPSLGKVKGRLEAHVNGFRYTTRRGETIDILYANVKHAIFQPCDRTRFVILHLHLRNPIMAGRKKCKDVQFFTEVVEASRNLKGMTTNAYDPEEIQEEQRERETMRRLNEAFRRFTSQCEKLEFDLPYIRSAFEGRPFKEMVTLYPCRDCLINVTEQPCFIITLDDIEHVHFQRMTFGTSTVDMIIIFKDYKRPVVEVDAVKVSDIDKVKEWLDSIDITFSESSKCFNWKELMNSIREEPRFWEDTYEDGEKKLVGWEILSDDRMEEEAEVEDASDFSEDLAPEDLEEDDDVSEDMDDDEDEPEDADAADSYDDEVEDEEEGEDWDDLDRKAEMEDKRRWGGDERKRTRP